MADPRQWRDIASTTRYPFLPTAPSQGDGAPFPEGIFADIQACCPGGRMTLVSYRRNEMDGIDGSFLAGEWAASFFAGSSTLEGGWCAITEDDTGYQVGIIVFCPQAYRLIDQIGTSSNTVNAEVIPSLLSDLPGGVAGFMTADGVVLRGNVIIETEPGGSAEGVWIQTDGGLDPTLIISAAGLQDFTPCDKVALKSINSVTPDQYGELVLQTSTGDLTGVLRILPESGKITFKLETK